MKITNELGLPEPLRLAMTPLMRPHERRGKADISVTELIDPPRIVRLKNWYWDKLEQDVSEVIDLALGIAFHNFVASYSGDWRSENRLYMTSGNMKISGAFDLLSPSGALYDFKVTKAYAVSGGRANEKWEPQLNIYRSMVEESGTKVKSMNIVAIVKDWSDKQAKDNEDYPSANIVTIPMEMWPAARTEAFIAGRVAEHSRRELPMCTPSERWERKEGFSVRLKGQDRFLTIRDSYAEAKRFVQAYREDNPKVTGELLIENFGGYPMRCMKYCVVYSVCDFGRRVHGLPPMVQVDAP